MGSLFQPRPPGARNASFHNLRRSLERSRVMVRCLWISAAVMHSVAASFLGGMAYSHFYLTQPALGYDYVTVLNLWRPVTVPVATFSALALLHVLRLLYMLTKFLRRPRRVAPAEPRSPTGLRGLVNLLRRHFRLLGVHGPYFEMKVAGRHVGVMATNTYRAYRTALLVGDPTINTTVAVVLCLYGLCLPLLWVSTQRTSRASRRLWTSIVHVALNFGMNVLLPVWVLRPYLTFFTAPDSLVLQYRDTYYPIGISICQTVLITSAFDYGLMLFTQLFLFSALFDYFDCFCSPTRRGATSELLADDERLRTKLRRLKTHANRLLSAGVDVRRRLSLSLSAKHRLSLVAFLVRPAVDVVPIAPPIPRQPVAPVVNYVVFMGYFLTVVWAFAMLGLNFIPLFPERCPHNCLAQTRPWLARTCACMVLEVTCDPDSNELELDFAVVAPTAVVFLIVSHCPRLTVPTSFSALLNLVGLLVYNSTIAAWPQEVTVTQLRRFSYAMIVDSNMTELPLGLLTEPSSTFIDLEVSHSSLASIALSAECFETLSVIYMEYCAFTEFPPQLQTHATMSEISFMYNLLTEIPPNLTYPAMTYLGFSGNPIAGEPPAALFEQPSLWEVDLEGTVISALPDVDMSFLTVTLNDTPYCANASNASDLVLCDVGPYVEGYFPMGKWNKIAVAAAHVPDDVAGRPTPSSHTLSLGFFWVVVLTMHAMAAGFLIFMAYAHAYLTQTADGYNYAVVLKLHEPVDASVIVLGVLGSLHVLAILSMLKRLLLRPRHVKYLATSGSCAVTKQSIASWWRYLLDCYGLFRVNGPYYEYKLALKHAIVAGSQTYRAYSTSVLVGVNSINGVFSVLLFSYGVLVPALWHCAKVPKKSRRQYTIIASVTLNFVANILLPAWILVPYYDYFTRPDAAVLAYADTFYPVGVSVCQSIFVTSLLDLVLTTITHLFLLTAIIDFLKSFRLPTRDMTSIQSGPIVSALARQLASWLTTGVIFGYIVSVFWAVAVVALNYAAWHREPCARGCLAQTYPWLTGKCACTVLETTCDANGSLLLPEDGGIETRSLVYLIVSHCPRLVMPPALSRFTNLVGLEIYNSTIARWGVDASIAAFSRFSYAMLVRTNMSDLPLGLFHNAPTTFIDLEISETNLSSINLDAPLLQTLTVLYVEHAQLQEFPWQLADHPGLNELSLMGNNIAEIPANLSLPSLNYLQLSSNPLTAVPDAAFGLPNLWELYVDNSFVSSFPTDASVFGGALSTIGAFNSTFCRNGYNDTCDGASCALVDCSADDYVDGYLKSAQIIDLRSATAASFFP
ncbi:hypothetical protein ACHHYP_02284 [Achlya hypogyna]|uniref:Uncharacterized protein n=1 Tax=Achlya hypogyna TaxID=1202772 RepID=A0A1V9Z7F0_ACHHY|nr:hypothetical protein ACHHYP_02284 [Achlya hypogyna]